MRVRVSAFGIVLLGILASGCIDGRFGYFREIVADRDSLDIYPIVGLVMERGYRVKVWRVEETGGVVWLEKLLDIQEDDPAVHVYFYFNGFPGQADSLDARIHARSTSPEASREVTAVQYLLEDEVYGR